MSDLNFEVNIKEFAQKQRLEDLIKKKPPKFNIEEYDKVPLKYTLKDWAENFALRDFYLNHNLVKNRWEYVHFLSVKNHVTNCYKKEHFYGRYERYSYLYSGKYIKYDFDARISDIDSSINLLKLDINISSGLENIKKEVSRLVKEAKLAKKCTSRSFSTQSYINNKYLAIADLLIYGKYCNIKIDANMINEYVFNKNPKEASTVSNLKKDQLCCKLFMKFAILVSNL